MQKFKIGSTHVTFNEREREREGGREGGRGPALHLNALMMNMTKRKKQELEQLQRLCSYLCSVWVTRASLCPSQSPRPSADPVYWTLHGGLKATDRTQDDGSRKLDKETGEGIVISILCATRFNEKTRRNSVIHIRQNALNQLDACLMYTLTV